MRSEMAHPCCGPVCRVRRISRSSVPCRRSSFIVVGCLQQHEAAIYGEGQSQNETATAGPWKLAWFDTPGVSMGHVAPVYRAHGSRGRQRKSPSSGRGGAMTGIEAIRPLDQPPMFAAKHLLCPVAGASALRSEERRV